MLGYSVVDFDKQHENLKQSALEGIESLFPIEGKRHTLTIKNLKVNDVKDMGDIPDQLNTKLSGKTWGNEIYGDLALTDNESGKQLHAVKNFKLGLLPRMTNRYSYVVNGTEYQVVNQLRLRPGLYHRRKDNGELETHINLARGKGGMKIHMVPGTGVFTWQVGTSNLQLYPILRHLGVDDNTIRKHWGDEVLRTNQEKSKTTFDHHIMNLHKKLFYDEAAPSLEEATKNVTDYLSTNTELWPDTTKLTLGKSYTTLSPEVMLKSSTKLLNINRGLEEPDDRDSLIFKTIHTVEDFVKERIQKQSKKTAFLDRLTRNTDKYEDVRHVLTSKEFTNLIGSFFNTALAQQDEQINPLHMLSTQFKVTVHGEGGIQSDQAVSLDARGVHHSHSGFIDPIHTPESHDVGAVFRMALGAVKDGQDLKTKVVDAKTQKAALLTPFQCYNSTVAFADSYTRDKKPLGEKVKAMVKGEIKEVAPNSVDYIMSAPANMFGFAVNSIPFLPAVQGNRSLTGSRQTEQALPITGREVPYVQVGLPTGPSMEEDIGKMSSLHSTVDGTVKEITPEHIVVQTSKGEQKLAYYNNFPLNAKHYFHEEPIVKPGDKIKKGQLLADSNYTKNGVLALGTNLRVAYIPWKGYGFEDGNVISESAAKKLGSTHMYKETIRLDPTVLMDSKKFSAYYPIALTKDKLALLDEEGLAQVGQKIEPGHHLAALLRKRVPRPEDNVLKGIHKSLVSPYIDASLKWDHDIPGEIVKIAKHDKEIDIYIKTEEPFAVADKLAGRYGNKGVTSLILPDNQMPHDADGNHVEVLLNPSGVPSRMNLGQLLETAAGKIAHKTGQTYKVQNFNGENLIKKVKADLAKHKLSDTEELFDPETNSSLGKIMVGYQYINKLDHSVSKKFNAREVAGYSQPEGIPGKGHGEGAQSEDVGFIYAMMAHGARNNLREMSIYKSEKNPELWRAIRDGRPIPPPKPTFVFDKFLAMLKAVGINTERKGDNLQIFPLTDKDVLAQSNGELKDAEQLRGKDLKELKGGLFDPELTGGILGSKWTHMTLAEPLPNPIFEDPIKTVLGIDEKAYNGLLEGKLHVDKLGQIVDTPTGLTGGNAIKTLLSKVNVKGELGKLHEQFPSSRGQKLDKLNKKYRILEALDKLGMSPTVYIQNHVPILPPKYRHIYPMPDGNLMTDDANHIYRNVILLNNKFKEGKEILPDEDINKMRMDLYKHMMHLTGLGESPDFSKRDIVGIINKIEGKNRSKEGFFQGKLVAKRQDLTARSTIINGVDLMPDEVGLPEAMLRVLYKPFILNRARAMGQMPLKIRAELEDTTKDLSPMVKKMMELEMENRPVMLNRAPTLHKFGIMAFKPRSVEGLAIKLHPLVMKGFNADTDGDTMSVHVPITEEARKEAFTMMPTNNIFNAKEDGLMLAPTQDSILGLYRLTIPGENTRRSYKSFSDAHSAVKRGDIKVNDMATIGGIKTSVGRYMANSILPKKYRNYDAVFNKKFVVSTLAKIGKEDQPSFGKTANDLKDLGFKHATTSGSTINLSDIEPITEFRDALLKKAEREIAIMRNKTDDPQETDDKACAIYQKVTDGINEYLKTKMDKNNNVFQMWDSGARGDLSNVRQLIAAPMLLADTKGRTIPTPVRHSYAEGLDTAEYFTQAYGTRKGAVDRSKMTAIPGYFAKRLVMDSIHQLCTHEEYGEDNEGIELPTEGNDTVDRYLAKAYKPYANKGDIVTPQLLEKLKKAGIGAINVRSPLTSQVPVGLAVRDVGLLEGGRTPRIGDNLGIKAAQAISEPGTQMSMTCTSKGALVVHKDNHGIIKESTIESLYNDMPGEKLQKWLIGENYALLNHSILDVNGQWTPIYKVTRHKPESGMISMVLENGAFLIIQDDHPMFVRDSIGSCIKCQGYRLMSVGNEGTKFLVKCLDCGNQATMDYYPYIAVREMKVQANRTTGKYLEYDLSHYATFKYAKEPTIPPAIAANFIMAGRIWNFGDPQKMELPALMLDVLHNEDRDELLTELKDYEHIYRDFSYEHKAIELSDKTLVKEIMHEMGLTKTQCRLPAWYTHSTEWTNNVLRYIFKNYMSLDDGSLTFTTDREPLAQQLTVLFNLRGYTFNISVKKAKFTFTLSPTPKIQKLLEGIDKFNDIAFTYSDKPVEDPKPKLVKVLRCEPINYTYNVYDVVTTSTAYLVSGIRNSNTFHTGGVAGSKVESNIPGGFARAMQLTDLPDIVKGKGTLANDDGVVEQISKNPVGGYDVTINGEEHYVPADRKLVVNLGDQVEKGQLISDGVIKPQELIQLKGLRPTQDYMVDELVKAYGSQGVAIKRVIMEVLVRGMTNLCRIDDPGSSENWVKGDYAPLAIIEHQNRKDKLNMEYTPILKGITTGPYYGNEDWLFRLAGRELQKTILQGASRGWSSPIHGYNPVTSFIMGAEFGRPKTKELKETGGY